jgi:hypothetical protein
LNALLCAIDQPVVSNRDLVQVKREFMTKHRRFIDILIETPTALIGIENKPYARQGKYQLEDYYRDLVERAGSSRSPCLVFLSESEPETNVDDTIVMHFYDRGEGHRSLYRLLDEVRHKIRSPRAQAFIEDFCDWIARYFGGMDMMNELSPYAEEVLSRFGDRRDRKAIGAVLLASNQIRRKVLDQIGLHIRDVLVEAYGDLEVGGELAACIDSTMWTVRRKSWPANCFLAIEPQKGGAADIVYGIKAIMPGATQEERFPNNICHDRNRIERSLENVAGGSSNKWWPWFRRAPTSIWSHEFVARLLIESDGQIEDHEDVKKITADMLRLAEAIEEVLRSGQQQGL